MACLCLSVLYIYVCIDPNRSSEPKQEFYYLKRVVFFSYIIVVNFGVICVCVKCPCRDLL